MYFYFYLFSSSRCGKCFVFFFLRIRKYSRITSNILAFISRILESERFYFELHPKRSETWPFSRAQWAASRMTAAGWHFKFNLNAVLCSTTDAIFPPWWSLREMHQFWALSSPLSHPLSFLITLGPPFFPAPLLSHLRLCRGYLSPPPRCVYFTSKRCRYTRFCYINIGSISKCTPFTGPSPLSPRIFHQASLPPRNEDPLRAV